MNRNTNNTPIDTLNSSFKRLTQTLADLLFPQPHYVSFLENATPSDICKRYKHARTDNRSNCTACFSYKDPLIRQAVWEIKYRGNARVIRLFADILAEHISADIEERVPVEHIPTPVIISSIPMPRTRLSERGFNQSDLLARAVERSLSSHKATKGARRNVHWATYCPMLKCAGNRHTQTSLSRKERLENMHNAFSVAEPDRVRGKVIFLVDDVTTTGATFAAAQKALKDAGAREVVGVAVAH